ncbi:aspartate aminotransferase [Pokkaliibacter plantistimulans]|uniref:Aminotransferase n=1 Tax=Proteobacteria bacterium 228 TaxID=2083153 RepID=A0A2S5KHE9_9PROT|nr:pyridoxal phosphate-dependent aminotransferase [Pokkaliibacter plantistimulans]PPC74231.1 aspartate aminotransferase [Pokkaliibacter plantistimulans]
MTKQFLSDRVQALPSSASLAAKAIVERLRAEGQAIIDFTIGEPDFDTPPHICAAAKQAIDQGDTHYTTSAGTLPLRQAIVQKLQRDNQLSYDSEQILVASGAKQIIYAAFEATLNAGDEVIVPAPYWVSYPDIAALHGAKVRLLDCPAAQGFKLTAAQLESAITPRSKWLILNSPNNPSGAVYSRDELQALASVLEAHPQLLVMSDEIYEDFIFAEGHNVSMASLSPTMYQRTLVVNGVSKAYAMTGWRIGYAAGPVDLIRAMTKLVSQTTTCPSSISQAAAVAALNGDKTCVQAFAAIYATRAQLMASLLNAIPGIDCPPPAGAFYLYPSVAGLIGRVTPDGKRLDNDKDVALYLLESCAVAVLDGSAYGSGPNLRFSFANTMDAIEEGCRRISKACAQLQ